MCHLCAILNGIAGIVVFSAPSAVSSAWFPPHERTTATGIALVFNNLGNAASFLSAPAIVPGPSMKKRTSYYLENNSTMLLDYRPICPILPQEETSLIKSRIAILMYFGKQKSSYNNSTHFKFMLKFYFFRGWFGTGMLLSHFNLLPIKT
jgi:nitrate/nitrite transporter NarK